MTEIGPKATGRLNLFTLEGALFAWSRSKQRPVLLDMPGSDLTYITCFSSPSQLRAFHERIGAPFDSIKRIEDGPEFIASIAVTPGVAIIIDPWFTLEGRVRFTQVYP